MRALILQIVLTLVAFTVSFAVIGSGFGPLEMVLWLALQVAVISWLVFRYKKRAVSAANGLERNPV
ncbi:hypothetical protein ACFWVF_32715 [Streptomyces sp. NPDC058659]|uniref:hypothetical protein n=1 Tax=unclassified Streptomyces TaxID=2593676 RepID=UPI0036480D0C